MTVQESIEKIILLTGSKAAAARKLSVDPKTIDNWFRIEDPQKPRDKALRLYLEGIVSELATQKGFSLDHARAAVPASESGLLPDPSPGSQ